jgi:hypothetical protein
LLLRVRMAQHRDSRRLSPNVIQHPFQGTHGARNLDMRRSNDSLDHTGYAVSLKLTKYSTARSAIVGRRRTSSRFSGPRWLHGASIEIS